MTATLSAIALGRHPFGMSDGREDHWRSQQYYGDQHDPSALSSQWSSTGQMALPQMMGMQDMDLRMFDNDNSIEIESYSDNLGRPLVPDYLHEPNRHSDVDMGTRVSSTVKFPTELSGHRYGMAHGSNSNFQYQPSSQHTTIPTSAHSRHSSQSVISPMPLYNTLIPPTSTGQRPPFSRSITAPEQRQYHSLNPDLSVALRSGSEEGDHEFVPHEDIKLRGRKRQRIPHTAVERRYRENLNAHLDDLRMTVPTFNRRSSGHVKVGENGDGGIKPSKCEVLKGAIEYITMLEKENALLKKEVKMMKRESDHVYSNTRR